MDTEAALLRALHDDPADETSWLALADWLAAGSKSGPSYCASRATCPAPRSARAGWPTSAG
jgi:uncharacterized protein (TIGR02996 family)